MAKVKTYDKFDSFALKKSVANQLNHKKELFPETGPEKLVEFLVAEGWLKQAVQHYLDEFGDGEEITNESRFIEYRNKRLQQYREDWALHCRKNEENPPYDGETALDWGDSRYD